MYCCFGFYNVYIVVCIVGMFKLVQTFKNQFLRQLFVYRLPMSRRSQRRL